MSTLADSFNDIQALLGTGFINLRQGQYHLARIEDPQLAAHWLSDLMQRRLVKCLADVRKPDGGEPVGQAANFNKKDPECVTLAFSHAGLRAMGLQEDASRPFPSAFSAGMAHSVRRRLLGDEADQNGDLEQWDWGDADLDNAVAVHVLIAHFWADGHIPALLFGAESLRAAGLKSAGSIATFPDAIRRGPNGQLTMYEPFGFQDGAGQPRIRGISPSLRQINSQLQHGGQPAANEESIWPGEFVLGHCNEYREISYCPSVLNWRQGQGLPLHFGSNGSYLVVRQIHQYAEDFKRTVASSAVDRLGSKMMGRRMNAWPLVGGPLPARDRDDFLYLAGDAPGLECPRGAHVRRAHPRDALAHTVGEGMASSRLHRLLRRGRVYTDSPDAGPTGNGMMFIALNADLDRQFEFVHRNWIMGSRFGDLSNEQDPILGTRPDRLFTVPGCPVGQRVGPLPRFTRVRGGGYFFMPGLQALRFIAGTSSGKYSGM
jgi:porphyrinogen peroxidase